MGKIELDHTGSGSGITLSSDGTDLLLDGTAVGGSPDLYRDNASSATTPSATGSNAVAIGSNSASSGNQSVALGGGNASGLGAFAFGLSSTSSSIYSNAFQRSTASGQGSFAAGSNGNNVGSVAAGTGSVALATSYASGNSSLAAAITNNTSSYGATGANSVAIGRLSKASGADSFAIGDNNIVANGDAFALGNTNNVGGGGTAFAIGTNHTVSGTLSACIGGSTSTASQTYAMTFGPYAKAAVQNAFIFGSKGWFSAGSAQGGMYILYADTTDATPEVLTTTNSAAGSTNQIVLPNDSVYGFTGTVIAREDSSSTDDFAVWEIKGGAVRGASASTTALGSYNINKISESTGASNWSIALSADTTNGAVAITVTGEAAHNIRWVATVNTTEVTY